MLSFTYTIWAYSAPIFGPYLLVLMTMQKQVRTTPGKPHNVTTCSSSQFGTCFQQYAAAAQRYLETWMLNGNF